MSTQQPASRSLSLSFALPTGLNWSATQSSETEAAAELEVEVEELVDEVDEEADFGEVGPSLEDDPLLLSLLSLFSTLDLFWIEDFRSFSSVKCLVNRSIARTCVTPSVSDPCCTTKRSSWDSCTVFSRKKESVVVKRMLSAVTLQRKGFKIRKEVTNSDGVTFVHQFDQTVLKHHLHHHSKHSPWLLLISSSFHD